MEKIKWHLFYYERTINGADDQLYDKPHYVELKADPTDIKGAIAEGQKKWDKIKQKARNLVPPYGFSYPRVELRVDLKD